MDRKASAGVLRFAGVVLDPSRGCLRGPDGADVPLAPKPFDLLVFMARHAGHITSKDGLLDAIWPGVHVTEDSLFYAVREARRAIGDEAGRVLRSVPRRGYMLDATVSVETPAGAAPNLAPAPLAPPDDRPSLVVLPFRNMSGDPEQDYFADGMVEDITTALSRTRWLFVIARNSAFTFKGRPVDVRDVGRELGVRYVLEGSVRKIGNSVRISCQLVEAENRQHVWADRFDGDLADIFALQDRVVEAVAGAIEPNLRLAEIERVRRKATSNLQAYDLYLRALAVNDLFTRDSVAAMLALCQKAIALDPHFTRAYGLASRAYIQMFSQGWMGTGKEELDVALSHAERGLATDRQDALMLAEAGHAFAYFGRQLERGVAYLDEAVAANPFLIEPLLKSGIVRQRLGQTEIAIEHLHRAHRLSPRDSRRYAIFASLSNAYLLDHEPQAAHNWAIRATQQNPNYLPAWRALASVAGHLGREQEARLAVERILAIRPGYSIAFFKSHSPQAAPEKWMIACDGLRQAGIPED